MLNWFNLTILSVLFLVTYFFLSKKIFNEEDDVDPRFFGASLQFATGAIALPIALISGFQFEVTTASLIFLALMTISYTIGPSLYYVGLKNVELSESMVLGSSSVLWSLFLGLLILGEELSTTKIIGVLLVFIAILLITYSPGIMKENFSKYKIMLLIAPVFYVLGATFDNKLVEFSNAVSYMSISFLLGGSVFLLANFPRFKTAGITTFKNKTFWKIIPINAVFIYLTYICILSAYELGGEVSRMFPIQQTESILVPLLGIILLKERDRVPVKILAAIITFVGILLVRL